MLISCVNAWQLIGYPRKGLMRYARTFSDVQCSQSDPIIFSSFLHTLICHFWFADHGICERITLSACLYKILWTYTWGKKIIMITLTCNWFSYLHWHKELMSVNYFQKNVRSASLIFIIFWSLCSRIQKHTFVSHLTDRANSVLI